MTALATGNFQNGNLRSLNDKCSIYIGDKKIDFRILPEISDSKKATYSDTTIIGRSTPIKTYSHSDNRVITMRVHFITLTKADIQKNIDDLWTIESATYPRQGHPYLPPPICKIDCGKVLGKEPLCCILDSYSFQAPTNVVWDEETLLPYFFSLSLTFYVVYASSSDDKRSLPNQELILSRGY